ncbi:MAG: DegT/DnrJ/EryC1/StrS family aminotransferase [Cyanobacteria bacterium P01_D01_bin.128]
MTSVSRSQIPSQIPFVDLSLQHQRIQTELMTAIETVVSQGDYILGQALKDFEQRFASACSSAYGVGVACGTDAIALGLQACGIGPGDEVLLPANTFVATLMGILRTGAVPVFVDCDPETALIDLKAAVRTITPKTRAIVPVHLYGQMVSPVELLDLAHRYNLLIFEDAAQAHLAERDGYQAGSVGIAAAFSFYPSKNLGALGDGGMVVTQSELVAQTVRSLRNYGATRKYFHTDPNGTNSRLDTMQAAVLQTKLPHLPEWNQSRNQAAQYYDQQLAALGNAGIVPLLNQVSTGHVYHLYVVRVMSNCLVDRTALQLALTAQGVQTGIHYPVPCHLQPAFHNLGHQPGDFPRAERLSQEILSLPMFPGLTTDQMDRVITAIQQTLDEAGRSRVQPVNSVA